MRPTPGRTLAAPALLAAFALWTCLATASCAEILSPPHITITHIQKPITAPDAALVNVSLHVDNPNALPIYAESIQYDVDVNGVAVGTGTIPENVRVDGHGAADVGTNVEINYWSALEAMGGGWPRTVHYVIHGDAGFSHALSVPITVEGDLPAPQAPGLSIDGLRPGVGLHGLTLSANLHIRNDNAFGYTVDPMTGSLSVGGVSFTAAATTPLQVPAHGTATTPLSVAIPFSARSDLEKALHQAATGGTVPYALDATLGIDGHPFTVKQSGAI
jgi:LEA14-like dessication related protein